VADIRVYIEDEFAANALRIHVVQRLGSDSMRFYKPDGTFQQMDMAMNSVPPRFPFIMPREAAHPLLDALSRHVGSVDHPALLREDYDRLRARHDLLVDHLLTSSDDNARAFRILTEQWGRPRR
jgi:hypothetical protein